MRSSRAHGAAVPGERSPLSTLPLRGRAPPRDSGIGVRTGSLAALVDTDLPGGRGALHGGSTRSKWLQYAQGYLGFAPFLLSPRIWVAWYNQTHHAITNQPGDPDAFPTLDEYKTQAGARFAVDKFAVGPNRLRGFWTMAFGFTIQCAHQTHSIKKFKYASGGSAVLAYVETALYVALWGGLLVAIGFVPWLFAFLVPHMIANAITIAYILTNHSLSPFIPINDPLITGLSVTVPKIVDMLTLNFGFHPEHQLFPAKSSRHARLIRT